MSSLLAYPYPTNLLYTVAVVVVVTVVNKPSLGTRLYLNVHSVCSLYSMRFIFTLVSYNEGIKSETNIGMTYTSGWLLGDQSLLPCPGDVHP